ncbi:MAG: insulinase family protein [Bacteroidia bacterium]|jgi:zinc protease|nr:insulinase family protein [Bacteroidia bacterium]
MRKSILTVFALMAALPLFSQATLIEKVEAQEGKLVIPYEKYLLSNGLTLIVSEDHSDPVTHINVTYHVGSARETPGKSGFAHFFEHMLFQGSKHVADEEHFKIIKEYGGEVNGNTTRDRTVYVETFPSNFTETALWMEADRMGFFLEGFTQEKFENQRATVKNEKDQRYDVPYGFLMEVKDQELYPFDHPYSWSTIGFVDDLDRADSSDLKNFFLRWYAPNNACIIVVGDVNTKEVIDWTQKYFGGIPAGKKVRKKRLPPVRLTENKVKNYPDPNAYVPLTYITYPGVPVAHKDEAALDMLAYLMGNTQSSILYKKFIDKELALQVQASNNPMSIINHELAGEFSFTLVGYPWSDMFKLKDQLMAILNDFENNNFTDEDLKRAKQNILSSLSNGFEVASNKANNISNFWYLDLKSADGTMYTMEDLAKTIGSVSREDIMRVYRKYIKGKYSSTINIQPNKPAKGEKAEKYQSYNPNASFQGSAALALEYQGLRERVVKDNFDRSIRPEPKEVKPVTIPDVYNLTLSNDIKVMGTEYTETPRVLALLRMEGGRLFEDGKKIPWGTAELMTSSLEIGTANKTPEQLENELEKLGARISFSSSNTGLSVYIGCEKQHLDATLALANEMLSQPRWDEEEFKKIRKRVVQGAQSALNNRGSGMRNAWRRLMYEESPLGVYVGAEDYDKISIDDCKKYFESYFKANNANLIFVGDLTKEEVKQKFAFLGNLPKSSDWNVPMPELAEEFKTSQIFGVQYTDAEQSDIMLSFRSLPYDYNSDFFKNTVMNFVLGGNFNSRLNLKIREDKGWTYGIRGGFSSSYKNMPGFYTVSAGVKAEATDSAINEVLWLMDDFRKNGITDEEFEFTKNALLASQALDFESLSKKAGFMAQMAYRNLPMNYTEQQLEILKSLTKEDLNALAKKYLTLENMVIVVAGDMVLLEDRLEELGLGKLQILEKDGSGKVKRYKKGKTSHIKNWK